MECSSLLYVHGRVCNVELINVVSTNMFGQVRIFVVFTATIECTHVKKELQSTK